MALVCEKCGESFDQMLAFAMLIDMGCKTNVHPSACTDEGGHRWQEQSKPDPDERTV